MGPEGSDQDKVILADAVEKANLCENSSHVTVKVGQVSVAPRVCGV